MFTLKVCNISYANRDDKALAFAIQLKPYEAAAAGCEGECMTINRRDFLTQAGVVSIYLATEIHRVAASPASAFSPSLAYRWINVTLDAAANEIEKHAPRPTVSSRLK